MKPFREAALEVYSFQKVSTQFAHSLTFVMFRPCTFLSNVLSMYISFIINVEMSVTVYMCTVNWFCVHLCSKLALFTFVHWF